MSKVIGVVFLLALAGQAFGQDFKDLMNKADKAYTKADFNTALDLYRQAETLQPNSPNVQLKIGLTYLSTTSFKFKALPYLKKAFAAQPTIDPLIDYYLGAAYQVTHEFASAREHYELFKKKNKRMSDIAQH